MTERKAPDETREDEETDYESSSERLQRSPAGRLVRFLRFINDLLR